MTKWIWLLSIFFPLISHAQTAVLDPKGILPKLRQYVAAQDFAHAFKCGDTAAKTVDIVTCAFEAMADGSRSRSCRGIEGGMLATDRVYNCSADQVSILTNATGESANVSKTQFDFVQGDMAELYLAQLGSVASYDGAVVTVTDLQDTTYTLSRGTPQQRKVAAKNLIGTYGPPGGAQVDLLLTILPRVQATAQIARFRMDSLTWFLLSDFAQGSGQ